MNNITIIINILNKFLKEKENLEFEYNKLDCLANLSKNLLIEIENANDDNLFQIALLYDTITTNKNCYNHFYESYLKEKDKEDKPLLNEIIEKLKNKIKHLAIEKEKIYKKLSEIKIKSIAALKVKESLQRRKHIKSTKDKEIVKTILMEHLKSHPEDLPETVNPSLLINELDYYNKTLIDEHNKERTLIPNIINMGYEEIETYNIPFDRLEPLNNQAQTIKNYLQTKETKKEIYKILDHFKMFHENQNEVYYILTSIMKTIILNMITDKDFLNNNGFLCEYSDRLETSKDYYKLMKKYLIIREYYNELLESNKKQEEVPEEKEIETGKESKTREIIFANPKDIKNDLDVITNKHSYTRIKNLIERFKKCDPTLETKKLVDQDFFEIKDDQIRIIYKHIKNNIYCITSIFIKKATNNKTKYQTICKRHVPTTKEELDQALKNSITIQEKLKDYIEEHERKGSR